MLRNNKKSNIKEIFAAKKPGISYIVAMPETRKSCRHTKSPPAERNEIAGEYLDLWQENLKYWAKDPDALGKWLAVARTQVKT